MAISVHSAEAARVVHVRAASPRRRVIPPSSQSPHTPALAAFQYPEMVVCSV